MARVPTTAEIMASRRAVDIATAADYLGVSVSQIRSLIKTRKLPAHRVGPKLLRVYLADLEKLRQAV